MGCQADLRSEFQSSTWHLYSPVSSAVGRSTRMTRCKYDRSARGVSAVTSTVRPLSGPSPPPASGPPPAIHWYTCSLSLMMAIASLGAAGMGLRRKYHLTTKPRSRCTSSMAESMARSGAGDDDRRSRAPFAVDSVPLTGRGSVGTITSPFSSSFSPPSNAYTQPNNSGGGTPPIAVAAGSGLASYDRTTDGTSTLTTRTIFTGVSAAWSVNKQKHQFSIVFHFAKKSLVSNHGKNYVYYWYESWIRFRFHCVKKKTKKELRSVNWTLCIFVKLKTSI